jgi:hypothetical protein
MFPNIGPTTLVWGLFEVSTLPGEAQRGLGKLAPMPPGPLSHPHSQPPGRGGTPQCSLFQCFGRCRPLPCGQECGWERVGVRVFGPGEGSVSARL